MIFKSKACRTGFTLIELLVVISIIGILSAVVLASLNTARVKARDAQRATNMHSIVNALEMYYLTYGCLPITNGTSCGPATGTYSDANSGGWDYSSQGGFMDFLKTAGYLPSVPVDPVNNMTGDTSPAGTYAFKYFCYPIGSSQGDGAHLGYWNETTGAYVKIVPQVGAAWTDSSFLCK